MVGGWGWLLTRTLVYVTTVGMAVEVLTASRVSLDGGDCLVEVIPDEVVGF